MTSPSGGAPMATEHRSASSPISIALAWIVVGVPLAWGVWQTAVKSMALFK